MKTNISSYLLTVCILFYSQIQLYAQVFSWAHAYANTGNYFGLDKTIVDKSNNTYSIGTFSSTFDVDGTNNVQNISPIGVGNMFLLKQDPEGNLIWVKRFPGRPSATSANIAKLNGRGLSLDSEGNIYIVGLFTDTFDFDPGPNVYEMNTPSGAIVNTNGFILKLDSNGVFQWVKKIGGLTDNNVAFNGLKIDRSNNLLLMGLVTQGSTVDIDPGPGIISVTGVAFFYEKLNADGQLIWAKKIDTLLSCFRLFLDSANNIYTTGSFYGTVDFDPGPGVNNMTYQGGNGDAFILKLDSMGSFQWAKQMGSGDQDGGNAIAVDKWGNVLVSGHFGATVDFDPGPGVYNMTSSSTRSMFTLKLRSSGDFVWARKSGYPAGLYESRDMTTDTTGNVYVAGLDYPLQKFDSSGNTLWELNTAGLTNLITLDHQNNIYLAGSFSGSQDFDPSSGTYYLSGPNNSGFLLKLDQSIPAHIRPVDGDLFVKVYPNPSRGSLTFSTTQAIESLHIYDMMGRVVMSKVPQQNYFTIDFSSYNNGLYGYRLLIKGQSINGVITLSK